MEGIHRERTNLTFRFWALEGRGFHGSMVIGVDGSPGMVLKPLENNGINYSNYSTGAGFQSSTVGGRDFFYQTKARTIPGNLAYKR